MPLLWPFAHLAFVAALALQLPDSLHEVSDGAPGITTDGGQFSFPAGAHPLAFWTGHPLDRRARNDLLIGINAPDGKPITPADYILDQQVRTLGTLAGHKIVQVLLFIHSGPRLQAQGEGGETPTQWKELLVQTSSGDSYLQIYGLQSGFNSYQPLTSAHLYGTGKNQILTTYEPDTGNGGGCSDGYWWFDHNGAHPVDFSPLERAVGRKLPRNTGFSDRCWAIHPETNTVGSGVQRTNAECHACGFVGDVTATYRISHGQALPVSITYAPSPNPD